MERILAVYAVSFMLMLMAAFWALRSDQSRSQKYARIRVRIDERHRQRLAEPADEELETRPLLEWLVMGIILLLVFMALANA